jgi:hypothetical protein
MLIDFPPWKSALIAALEGGLNISAQILKSK